MNSCLFKARGKNQIKKARCTSVATGTYAASIRLALVGVAATCTYAASMVLLLIRKQLQKKLVATVLPTEPTPMQKKLQEKRRGTSIPALPDLLADRCRPRMYLEIVTCNSGNPQGVTTFTRYKMNSLVLGTKYPDGIPHFVKENPQAIFRATASTRMH